MHLDCYTPAALRALALAVSCSEHSGDGYVGTVHLLLGLMLAETDDNTPCVAAKLLRAHTMTAHAIAQIQPLPKERFEEQITDVDTLYQRIVEAKEQFTPVLCRILSRAKEEAERFLIERRNGEAVIGTEHLLFSMLCENDAAAHHFLTQQNLPLHELYGDILSFLSAITAEEAIFSGLHDSQADDITNKKMADRMTENPYLLNMTASAAAGKYDAVVGRETEEENILRILLHRQKNNPCLLGEAGVGKTAIVEGLAARIAHGTVPSILQNVQIFSLDLGAMLAGAKYRGEFEERLKSVLSFCRRQESIPILFIDELHMLMGAGSAEGGADAANLLKPALSRGEIRIIGATTKAEYDKSIGRDGAMSRRFQTVTVEEPSEENAVRMLCALRPKLETHHRVQIPDETLHCAVRTAVRCLPQYFLPDKAIDLLDDACAASHSLHSVQSAPTMEQERDTALLAGDLSAAQQAVQRATDKNESSITVSEPTVTEHDILCAAQRRTGILLTSDADTDEKYRLLEQKLNSKIYGQQKAIAQIAQTLLRCHTGLSAGKGPRASFLFYGPSGVGKTAVCEALAEMLYDTPHAFLRFDMSEYREAHTVSRLIGAPPGYIGHEDGGLLTAAIRHRPYCFVLFDEMEKAHPDIHRLFLQILDNGTLTDSRGNTVSFRHTVLVMTANTANTEPRPLGFQTSDPTLNDSQMLGQFFSDEFLARLDAKIRFLPLSEPTAHQILERHLHALAERLGNRGITLNIDHRVMTFLYHRSPKNHGARGLSHAVEQFAEPVIAHALLEQSIVFGDTLTLTVSDDELVLQKEPSNGML